MRDFESGAPPRARPPCGGRIASTSLPLRASIHAIESNSTSRPLRIHRPQTGVGTCATCSRTFRASGSSLESVRGCRQPRQHRGYGRLNQEPDLVREESETPGPACADRGPRPPRRARFRSDRVRGLLDDVDYRGDADLEGRVVESTEDAARGMPLSPRNAPVEPDEVPAGTERKPVEIKSGATSGDAHYLGRCSYREARPHYHPTPPAPARRAPGGRARPGRAGLPDPCIIFRRRAGRLR